MPARAEDHVSTATGKGARQAGVQPPVRTRRTGQTLQATVEE